MISRLLFCLLLADAEPGLIDWAGHHASWCLANGRDNVRPGPTHTGVLIYFSVYWQLIPHLLSCLLPTDAEPELVDWAGHPASWCLANGCDNVRPGPTHI